MASSEPYRERLWASCYVPGCNISNSKTSFHRLPAGKDLCDKWVSFIYKDSEIPSPLSTKLRVCSAHFTDDCVSNLTKVTMGFAHKRILKPDAVPTVYPGDTAKRTSSAISAVLDQIRSSDVGVQCHIKQKIGTQTVGTQMSEGGPGKIIRSKGVQVKPSTKTAWVGTDPAAIGGSSSAAVVDGPPPMKRACLDLPPWRDTADSQNTTDSSYRPDGSSWGDSSITYTNAEPVYNPKDSTKYIVYEESLLSLFQHCPICTCNCVVKRTARGTMLSIEQKCPGCGYNRQWNSQPIIGSTPAGDLQLSAAISFTGSTFAQVDKVLAALKVKSISKTTYHKHARNYLDPCIYSTWKTTQTRLLQTMGSKDSVILGGNMRADGPAHNAKYDYYAVSDIESGNVVDVQLVQSNEVSRSNGMEKEGLVRSLNFLESSGVKIDTLITDRRLQVNEYLQEEKPHVTHYYDVRQVAKDVSQKVEQLGKEKDCEVIQKWQHSIVNHLYWSTHKSPSGEDAVARWSSLVNHLHNVHDHTNVLFPKCLHLHCRTKHWLKAGTKPSIKLQKIIQNKSLLKDVAKLSPLHQTSDIERFHSLILRFAPRNVMFAFRGMLCRLYLAAMHHNENKRRHHLQKHGTCVYQIWYPKCKKGKYFPTKKQPTLNYVKNLMDVLFEEVLTDPGRFTAKLNERPIPPSP